MQTIGKDAYIGLNNSESARNVSDLKKKKAITGDPYGYDKVNVMHHQNSAKVILPTNSSINVHSRYKSVNQIMSQNKV